MQLSGGDGSAHLVQFDGKDWSAPRLKAAAGRPGVLKIFHFARFDLAVLAQHLGVVPEPVYCTKIASKLARTYTDRHGLKDLCSELLGIELSKQQQSSDWGADKLTDQQKHYAASDVLHLHALKAKLDAMLAARGPDGAWPRPASASCPCAPASTSPASRTSTSSRIDAVRRGGRGLPIAKPAVLRPARLPQVPISPKLAASLRATRARVGTSRRGAVASPMAITIDMRGRAGPQASLRCGARCASDRARAFRRARRHTPAGQGAAPCPAG